MPVRGFPRIMSLARSLPMAHYAVQAVQVARAGGVWWRSRLEKAPIQYSRTRCTVGWDAGALSLASGEDHVADAFPPAWQRRPFPAQRVVQR